MSPAAPDPAQIERAVLRARRWQERAGELQTRPERRQQAELDRLLRAPKEKATLIQMTDQAFRTRSPLRTVDQFSHILDVQGVPRFFSPVERALLRGFQTFGGWLPSVSVPLVKEHMQHETANVVLPAERELLTEHLRARQCAGLRMNVNFLGEALLGEGEAEARLKRYLEALQIPELEVLSVKISTLYSQISPLAGEATLGVLCERLELLYREAAHLRFVRPDGSVVPKFVYLDMEEYRDMSLTAEALMRTLDRPGLEHVSAGIALQAYLPDSLLTQRELNAWARERVARGGAPVTIRLVKGANLEMERVEASLRGWPQAPYKTKRETDANYVRMLCEAVRPENLAAMRVGVASHNLFDLALGAVLASDAGAGERVQFEMLEGMANHQRRALAESERNLLLYAPACQRADFVSAIGYLVRRLDENTGPDNFLRHAFRLQTDSPEWRQLEAQFRESCEAHQAEGAPSPRVPPIADANAPRRTQDRRRPIIPSESSGAETLSSFLNEPDTDFALRQNGQWAEEILARWRDRVTEIPLVIDGAEIRSSEPAVESRDPSRPGVLVARHGQAGLAEIESALACARRDEDGWRTAAPAARSAILAAVANELRAARGDLIGAALANTGKTVSESDPEVSEAIDFVEYYRRSATEFYALPNVEARPLGVAVVVPPWNFPIAIPCGGIAAALAAGNTVIVKPATPAVLVAWELCRCFWRGGISKKTLQFVPCSGEGAASQLVTHPAVDAVILTGGTATAHHLLRQRADLPLSAETGGKNAMIVTALSDREQAVKHAVHSAFSHGGQKCSATSLLLLEAEVYDDPHFQRMLVDTASSLCVGSTWELQTRVGPLIRAPRGELERGLKTLEPGESWALLPENREGNPHLWSPGIKYGVPPGSFTHLTELFGPVLGVMRFTALEEAIELVHQTGYGLTSGLQSLDDREQEIWKSAIQAGNLYVNKPTVGAIVQRQPFGGMGKSALGPGLHAGGPNYVAQFIAFRNAPNPDERLPEIRDAELAALASDLRANAPKDHSSIVRAVASYEEAWSAEFGGEHDDVRLLGEDNVRRYRPFSEMRVRVDPRDSQYEIFARVCAARVTGARVVVSAPPAGILPALQLLESLTADWGGAIEFLEETDDALAGEIRRGSPERIRFAAPDRVPAQVRAAAAETGTFLADRPVLAQGRVELLWYLREQSVSFAYHRYGNLVGRAGEARTEPM